MTEEEAKTKLCPKASTFNASSPWPWSSEQDDDFPAKCIASACMAWRWIAQPREAETREIALIQDMPGDPPFQYRDYPEVIGNGFCGLAGGIS